MPPFGQFHADPAADAAKNYLAFAGGSGITPILSIMRTVLNTEPRSRFTLFYSNRRKQTAMFIDDLYALKNMFPDRVQLNFVFTREAQEFEIFSGRLDAERVPRLYEAFCNALPPDEVFICGPDTMIETVSEALATLSVDPAIIRSERFGVPRRRQESKPQEVAEDAADAIIDVVMDGHRMSFPMSAGDGNLVDAAARQGIDLPYSCKGGVCATCRTHVREGEVTMAANYGLEPWEVEAGFVLACQSTPVSDRVTVDYDKT